MTTITFDTHDFVKKLKGVGFSEEQAEVLTDLQKTTVSNTLEQARHDYELDDLATKRDLKELELIMRKDMAESKADLIRWVVGVGLLQITIIAGLLFRLTGKV
ncbi:MAG: DUF1640 domain-containing protein [Methylobacter sp.]|nr:DUF1640 domain-containing protein [Methylobacter sp.]